MADGAQFRVIGRVEHVEIREINGGKKVATVHVEVVTTGGNREYVYHVPVQCWHMATATQLQPGDSVTCEGRVSTWARTGKDGTVWHTLQLTAESIVTTARAAMPRPAQAAAAPPASAAPLPETPPRHGSAAGLPEEPPPVDDDIPF